VSAEITYVLSPTLSMESLNDLFSASWPRHVPTDFSEVLARSLVYVCAYDAERLVGFANLAWDGGVHAFLLDPTVHPDYRRRGVGRELVRRAVELARERGLEWVHVDFEPSLRPFYDACGFRSTDAGLIRLRSDC
jgi:GNAT superfamily N-acetyltransferase